MASVVLSGDTSGSITVSAPTVSGSNTQTLVATTGTLAPIVSATAQASTSGTSIDFTSIPSWVKRITVMFQGVSTNGTSSYQIQIGAGSVTTSGYAAVNVSTAGSGIATTAYTSGFIIVVPSAATNLNSGAVVLTNLTSNTWAVQGVVASTDTTRSNICAGSISLGGTLDQVRITTVNGTDTFDAGSINILYE